MTGTSLKVVTEQPIKGRFAINWAYLPFKMIYFTFMAGQSAVVFRSIFMKHLGMSTTQNGIVFAADRLFGIVAALVLGLISDKSKRPKTVLQVLFVSGCLLSAVQCFILPEDGGDMNCFNITCALLGDKSSCNYTEAHPVQRKYTDHCAMLLSNQTAPGNLTQDLTLNSGMTCACLPGASSDTGDVYGATFWLLLVVMPVLSTSVFSGSGLLDVFVLHKFSAETRHRFGRQRMFGGLGFGSGALMLGFLQDKFALFDLGPNSAFIPYAFIPVVMWTFLLVAMSFVDSSSAEETTCFRISHIKIILSDVRLAFFLFYTVAFGYALGCGEIYMLWLAKERFNAPGLLYGMAIAIPASMDSVMAMLSGWLLRRFGIRKIMVTGLALMSVRLALYTLATNAWHLIAIDTLRGASWGCPWIACCNLATRLSPPELRATTMGLANASLFGIGYGVAGLCGGILYEQLGADNMFLVSFGATFLALLIYATFLVCYDMFACGQPASSTVDDPEELKYMKDENANPKIDEAERILDER